MNLLLLKKTKTYLVILIVLLFNLVLGNATEVKLTPNDALEIDHFGSSVAISGNYAIVGETFPSPTEIHYSAYIFEYNGNFWEQQAKLTVSGEKYFGTDVSISSNYAVIGAYIFFRNGQEWVQQTKLSSNNLNPEIPDCFGCSVSISNNYIIIGASNDSNNGSIQEGAAYIYTSEDNKWIQQSKVKPNDAAPYNYFGSDVSISEDYAIVGARFTDNNNIDNTGAAYIFKRNNNQWLQHSKIMANDGEKDDHFGSSVHIYDKYAIVGATGDDDEGYNRGVAYIYVLENNTWIQQAKLTAKDSLFFGNDVWICDQYAIVGSSNAGNEYGIVYIFYYNENKWVQKIKLTASDGGYLDRFGSAVSASKDYVIIGAPNNDEKGDDSGAAYIYPYRQMNIISGYVKDIRDNPFKSAKIKFEESDETTTDENGYYNIQLPYYYTGKATISYNNYIFDPSNITYEKLSEDKPNQNYSIMLYTISGFIKDIYGNPITGVEINFSNQGGKAYTNQDGFFNHDVYHNWSGEIRIVGKGYKYEPIVRQYNNVSQNFADQSFQASKLSISGFCFNNENSPLSGIEIQAIPNEIKTTTDESGFYIFEMDYKWNGKVVANKPGYVFDPGFIEYKDLINSYGEQNFIGTPKTIKISGIILDNKGNPIESVSIQNNNNVELAITDLNGKYEIIKSFPFNTTLIPIKTDYTFDPSTRDYFNISEDQTEQNFQGIFNQTIINVSPNKLQLSSQKGIEHIFIETKNNQISWTASLYASSEWIKLSRSANSILVEYSDNNHKCEKYAVILVQSGEIKHLIEVIQEANHSDISPPDWIVDPSNYRYQGMITAILQDENKNLYQSNNDLLGAFVDNECRGLVSPSPALDEKRFFLQVWSNDTNEKMKFKYYDSKNNIIYENIQSDIQFIPDMVIGDIQNPHILILKQTTHIPDANEDGKVDVIDAIEVLQFITNIE